MPNLVLGLDVSTSITGISITDSSINPGGGANILYLDAIDFKKCKSIWEKCDLAKNELLSLKLKFPNISIFALEEPLLGFSKGMSSATTITTLMRFNGIISYIGREVFSIDPTYISAASARKLCGIKLQKTSLSGMSHKDQVFKYMSENDLSHVQWPLTPKSKVVVPWAKDATDAYVISRAAGLIYK
jgi:hypothetical protein